MAIEYAKKILVVVGEMIDMNAGVFHKGSPTYINKAVIPFIWQTA